MPWTGFLGVLKQREFQILYRERYLSPLGYYPNEEREWRPEQIVAAHPEMKLLLQAVSGLNSRGEEVFCEGEVGGAFRVKDSRRIPDPYSLAANGGHRLFTDGRVMFNHLILLGEDLEPWFESYCAEADPAVPPRRDYVISYLYGAWDMEKAFQAWKDLLQTFPNWVLAFAQPEEEPQVEEIE
jgi:hypothetical protein